MSGARVGREQVLAALRAAAEGEPCVLAAYLGGSDATGRTDGLSDVDLGLIGEDGTTERVLGVVRSALAALSPISYEFRMPEPAWHGMTQVFWGLEGAPDWLVVDLCVMERNRPTMFTERERHGEPVVWFDREGLVVVNDLDRVKHSEKVRAGVRVAVGMLGLGGPLVRKGLARGCVAEASAFYHRMVLGQVVVLARAVHCPERFDFGARYLDRDVPAGVRAQIDRLSLPAGLEGLESATAECEAWGRELAEHLQG